MTTSQYRAAFTTGRRSDGAPLMPVGTTVGFVRLMLRVADQHAKKKSVYKHHLAVTAAASLTSFKVQRHFASAKFHASSGITIIACKSAANTGGRCTITGTVSVICMPERY